MKLVVLCQTQFGYHLDTWYYCKYLEYKNIDYVCWDYGKPKKVMDNVNAVYASRQSSSCKRYFNYLKLCINTIRLKKPDCVFVKYFKLCFLLKICFPNVKFILDIRTADVNKSQKKRIFNDFLLRFEASFFSKISVISESLKIRLRLPKYTYVLPLGADKLSNTKKSIDKLNLIYVGTLTNRDIFKTVVGLKKYIDKYGSTNISYDIIGSGWDNEENQLREYITSTGMENVVKVHGYIHHDDLGSHFDRCNIGISFVPKTSYFDSQPPTKTFEYLLSDMVVIATSTSENRLAVDGFDQHSILIEDNEESFVNALVMISENVDYYNKREESTVFKIHTWPVIVTKLDEYLTSK